MQCGLLHGFERDINSLIDAFALQAELEQTFSLFTFKNLFKAGGYAYIHQAYLGCEHSPEYTQLLYATALDRLDFLSPTAAPSSALWPMHVAKPQAADAGAAALPQAGPSQWSLAGVEQTALAAGAAADAAARAAAAAAAAAAAGSAEGSAAAPAQQQGDTVPSMLNGGVLPGGGLAAGSTCEQQQTDPQLPLRQSLPELQLQPLGGPVQQQQQQEQQPAPLGAQLLRDHADGLQEQQQQQLQQLPPEVKSGAAVQSAPPSAAAPACDSEPCDPLDDELSDDFFNDLLAIFDEAEGLQTDGMQDAKAAAPAPAPAARAAAAAGPAGAQQQAAAAAATEGESASVPTQQPAPQQQRPAISVPLAVKAGVVFMLHCLHDTQLNSPPAAIYTSLQHLQLLQQAAVQFAATGVAGADALGVLQLLIRQQRLLVGQFRRPVHWVPQLPAWLAPPKPRYPDLGVGLAAANRAAARAHNGARVAAVHAAANAARSLRVNPRSVDPVVHREALFHIKTALRSLANFRSLQDLCSKYSGARQAIFEPLLRIREPVINVAKQQQQQQEEEHQQQQTQEQQQQQQAHGCKRDRKSKADGASKRSKKQADTQAVDRSQKYVLLLQEQLQQQRQREVQRQQAAAAAEAARAAGIPELFDPRFGANLLQLAGDEAAQMLVLLDPGRNPGYMRSRLKQQEQALEEADAVQTAAAGRSRNAHLQVLASGSQQRGTAGSSKQGARRLGSAGAAAVLKQQQQGWQYLQELCDAGVLHPAELQELQEDESEGSVQGFGAAGQVLQLQRQRRQHTLVLAEQWFRSHDALMMQADADEDMP